MKALFAAATVAAFAAMGPSVPAGAQDSLFNEGKLDPVTQAVLSNSLTQLRFRALSLEDPDAAGQALNGVVRAWLARDEPQTAMQEIERFEDEVWRARSLIAIAQYLHRKQDDTAQALVYLDRAKKRILSGSPDTPEAQKTLQIISMQQARLGDYKAATATAGTIKDRRTRVDSLQEAARISVERTSDANSRKDAAAVLREAFNQARDMPYRSQKDGDLIIAIGRAQLRAGDTAGARATFDFIREKIMNGPETGKYQAASRLAAGMVDAENLKDAMEVVRSIPDMAQRVTAIASVARSLGQEDMDSAVPLFRLALDEVEQIEEESEKIAVLGHLVREQTHVGRLADAFTTAGKIEDQLTQSHVLLDMAEILLGQGKTEEALILTDYIPYLALRAQIFAAVAQSRGRNGDAKGASELLSEALDATGFPIQVEFLPKALDDVLTAQVKYGEMASDDAIFARARELLSTIRGEIDLIRGLVRIAITEARRGRIDDAQKTISSAYRSTFENIEKSGADKALQDISLAQLAAGDLIAAFDTAARIPPPKDPSAVKRAPDGSFLHPRYRALIHVAAAAARTGDVSLGIRVANKLEDKSANAAALAAVAVAVASPEADLVDIVGEAAKGGLEALLTEADTPSL